MIHAETLDLVEGYQHPGEEQFVLLLEWQGKSIDNGSENFQ
jgi:hypothetical protein